MHSLGELVAYSAAHPGELNYGSPGVGSSGHVHAEALLSLTGMNLPYCFGVGRVHMGIMPTLNTVAFVKAGKMRALAVEAAQRLPSLPDVPTVAIPSTLSLPPPLQRASGNSLKKRSPSGRSRKPGGTSGPQLRRGPNQCSAVISTTSWCSSR